MEKENYRMVRGQSWGDKAADGGTCRPNRAGTVLRKRNETIVVLLLGTVRWRWVFTSKLSDMRDTILLHFASLQELEFALHTELNSFASQAQRACHCIASL
jgi:hypothetical protein